MTTREPEWDEDSRAHVLALIAVEHQTCRCGGFLPETTDPANEGKYDAQPPGRCHRCTAIHHLMKRYDEDPGLVLWTAEKR